MTRELWRDTYDTENCPRGDGGRLIDRGEMADYPGDVPQRFFSCSRCCKWWTVIELRRRDREAFLRGTDAAAAQPEGEG